MELGKSEGLYKLRKEYFEKGVIPSSELEEVNVRLKDVREAFENSFEAELIAVVDGEEVNILSFDEKNIV